MNETVEFKAIGTSWQISFNSTDKIKTKQVTSAIKNRVEVFEQDYSRFREDSFVGRIAKEAGRYELPKDAERMLALYRKLYDITDGKVTPLIGEVLVATGYDKDYSLTPQEVIPTAPDWDEVMSYDVPILTTQRPLRLDFGGLGKGYIVDIVASLLDSHDIDTYMVNAGGDIAYATNDEKKFQVVLEDPADATMGIGEVTLLNKSIAGSSGNRRTWGKYHHILDPDSTESPRHIAGLWVVADTTLLADAIATALFFTTPEILREHFEFEYLIIDDKRTATVSRDFPGMVYS